MDHDIDLAVKVLFCQVNVIRQIFLQIDPCSHIPCISVYIQSRIRYVNLGNILNYIPFTRNQNRGRCTLNHAGKRIPLCRLPCGSKAQRHTFCLQYFNIHLHLFQTLFQVFIGHGIPLGIKQLDGCVCPNILGHP